MHPRHTDLARRFISGCAPFDTLRLRKRLARMLKVDKTPADLASAPQVHHSTINAVLRPIAACLSPGCQTEWGRLAQGSSTALVAPAQTTYGGPASHVRHQARVKVWLMVWASQQVGSASVGVPVTPLPKGLRKYVIGPRKFYGELSRPPPY